ncbi:adenylyl-sulfate kinase [Luteipulveratus halotolerans]|uniref:Adenylyl-sulfate kinase n=1 Tax=Luteipulveratus halotolerans TaxID=1631356 RepID=A0A0L6CII1_9MICO|nr:adenylyl-sulfate kinase [Luteipulveratus halotolerans]KNX37524.1 adenylylsulfate kinase [Luteipulveratus halotolerans]
MSAQAPTGATVWLTGLSGAGKTTVADALAERLRAEGRAVEVLDGDELRTNLSAGLGFSREDRSTHVRRVGFVAELLARHGVVALVPVIAPYADARADVRRHHDEHGTPYVEVHVATPLAECARRDVKGLYAKAQAGELTGMTGVDDPYEEPEAPDLRLDTTGVPLSEAVDQVHRLLTASTTDTALTTEEAS